MGGLAVWVGRARWWRPRDPLPARPRADAHGPSIRQDGPQAVLAMRAEPPPAASSTSRGSPSASSLRQLRSRCWAGARCARRRADSQDRTSASCERARMVQRAMNSRSGASASRRAALRQLVEQSTPAPPLPLVSTTGAAGRRSPCSSAAHVVMESPVAVIRSRARHRLRTPRSAPRAGVPPRRSMYMPNHDMRSGRRHRAREGRDRSRRRRRGGDSSGGS